MRPVIDCFARRLFVAVALTVVMSDFAAAQVFGGSENKTAPPALHQDSEVKQTAWPSIPMPKISMPKISMPDMSVVTGPVKSGYSKVTSGTKKAWEGTKEMFTFGDGESAQQTAAASEPKQGFWSRMFSKEEEKPSGPQTVGEWMSQPRLDP
jgi:hypothetical protein